MNGRMERMVVKIDGQSRIDIETFARIMKRRGELCAQPSGDTDGFRKTLPRQAFPNWRKGQP